MSLRARLAMAPHSRRAGDVRGGGRADLSGHRQGVRATLLLPIGFGALLGNLPNSPLNHPGGLLYILNDIGMKTEIFPLFIFIGIGALMDFRPLSQPIFALMGAAGQFGIFLRRRSSLRPSAFR